MLHHPRYISLFGATSGMSDRLCCCALHHTNVPQELADRRTLGWKKPDLTESRSKMPIYLMGSWECLPTSPCLQAALWPAWVVRLPVLLNPCDLYMALASVYSWRILGISVAGLRCTGLLWLFGNPDWLHQLNSPADRTLHATWAPTLPRLLTFTDDCFWACCKVRRLGKTGNISQWFLKHCVPAHHNLQICTLSLTKVPFWLGNSVVCFFNSLPF